MNPSALFTYARVSISRSASAHEGRGRRNERRVSRARNILRFRALASFSSSSFFFVPPLLYFEPLSLFLFLIPLLTNLHILPFSCNAMHNPPFPFSSLSHLHPLVSFVGKSIPSIPSPICPCISNLARFHGSFNFVTGCLCQVYDFLQLKLRTHRNPCRER